MFFSVLHVYIENVHNYYICSYAVDVLVDYRSNTNYDKLIIAMNIFDGFINRIFTLLVITSWWLEAK